MWGIYQTAFLDTFAARLSGKAKNTGISFKRSHFLTSNCQYNRNNVSVEHNRRQGLRGLGPGAKGSIMRPT